MKLAAAVIIAGTLLSIGFCMETSRKETAKQLQELIRFLLFAGQEIEIRGSILEDVFTKASSITQGATKELVSRMAKRMAEGGDFLQEWSHAVNEVYRKMGGQYKGNSGKLLVNGKNVQSPVKLLETGVYPGFPTDMQSIFGAILAVAKGTSIITETIFENRFKYLTELKRMGAKNQQEGNVAIITGVKRLAGTSINSTDLRGGASLVLDCRQKV